jgi:hypothetical protein
LALALAAAAAARSTQQQRLSVPPSLQGQHTGFLRLNYYPTAHPLAQQAQQADGDQLFGVHHHTGERHGAAEVCCARGAARPGQSS